VFDPWSAIHGCSSSGNRDKGDGGKTDGIDPEELRNVPHVKGAFEDPVTGGRELCGEHLQELFVGLEHRLVILCDHNRASSGIGRDRRSCERRSEGKRRSGGTC